MCYIQDVRIQDASSVIQLTFSSSRSVEFHLCLFEDSQAATSGVSGDSVALSDITGAAFLG